MNIKIVFPSEEKDKKALQDRIDTLHCQMIFATLNELDLTYDEKLQLLKETQKIIATKSFNPNWMNHYEHQKVG